jgi:hypothetical protein
MYAEVTHYVRDIMRNLYIKIACELLGVQRYEVECVPSHEWTYELLQSLSNQV